MNTNTNQPLPIERASTASPDDIDEELRRYEEHLHDVRDWHLEHAATMCVSLIAYCIGSSQMAPSICLNCSPPMCGNTLRASCMLTAHHPTHPVWPQGFGVTSTTEALAAIKSMHLLQAGIDISVIALWLGHEGPVTTHQYVEADLAMKERASGQTPRAGRKNPTLSGS